MMFGKLNWEEKEEKLIGTSGCGKYRAEIYHCDERSEWHYFIFHNDSKYICSKELSSKSLSVEQQKQIVQNLVSLNFAF